MNYFANIRNFFKTKNYLLNSEFVLLSLMIASLPSLEAPKNIFLVLFVIVAITRQIKTTSLHQWGTWDWMFSGFIACALLSAVFAGLAPGNEFGGFRMLLTYTSVGWLISRSNYSTKQISFLFWLIIISTIPPLLWGLWKYFFAHAHELQLHSVGHVNHSAIYLTMIFGASVGACIAEFKSSNNINRLLMLLLSLVLFSSLIISASRAAFGIGLLIAVILILLMGNSKKVKLVSLAILSLPVILMLLLNTQIVKKEKSLEEGHDFLSRRLDVWNVPLEASRFNPILGIGMNNWKKIELSRLKSSVEQRGETFDSSKYYLEVGHAHNLYLQALLERGILGLTSIIFLMLLWLKALNRSFQKTTFLTTEKYIFAGSLSAWITTFGIGFVNSTFHHEHAILACLFLGLHLCMSKTHIK